VRGVEFAKKLLEQYSVHIYDSLKGVVTPFCVKKDPTKNENEELEFFVSSLY